MPTNTFSLGKDCQVVLVSPLGGNVDLSIVTEFDAKQEIHDLKVRPLNGPPQGAMLPDGWTGTFTMDRANPAADQLMSAIEAGYWAGGNLGVGAVYQYVQEVNGAQSIYAFNNATISLSDTGAWKADSSVKQTIKFFASTRTKLA